MKHQLPRAAEDQYTGERGLLVEIDHPWVSTIPLRGSLCSDVISRRRSKYFGVACFLACFACFAPLASQWSGVVAFGYY